MLLTYNEMNGIFIISVKGKIDAFTAEEFKQTVLKTTPNKDKILFDCSELNYISSAGIRTFYYFGKHFESSNVKIVFASFNSDVKNVLDLIDFQTDFTVVSNVNEGLTAF